MHPVGTDVPPRYALAVTGESKAAYLQSRGLTPTLLTVSPSQPQ